MSDNMELWRQVEKTDPAHTKQITGKSYKGNSPKPHWIIRKATETFGPCGIGWGFRIIKERIEAGHLIEAGFYQKIHIARVEVWYEWKGKRGTVEHIGETEFAGKRKSGDLYTDEDAPKKSVTDALIKALSMIGFAGDIFLGRYDDSKYIEATRKEFDDLEDNVIVTVEQVRELERLITQTGTDLPKFLDYCQVKALAMIRQKDYPRFRDALRSKASNPAKAGAA